MENKKTLKEYFINFIPHFKTMKVVDIIILVCELILIILLLTLGINFLVDFSKGQHFLGEKLVAYEIVVTCFVFILLGFNIFQFIYDLIFKDYTKKTITKKVVRNGHVIEIENKD